MLCGFKEIYDMPFEKFSKMVLETSILSPTIRKYKAENPYYEFFKQDNKNATEKVKKRKTQETDPMYQALK